MVRIDGKFFSDGDERFRFSGVTYGTFAPRPGDGALFPGAGRVKEDFAAMGSAGFTVVRTYTTPPDDVVEAAGSADLKLLAGVFYPDWRYLVGCSRRQAAAIQREARSAVRDAASRLSGCDAVLGLCLGNEIPADVVRWLGTARVASWVAELCEVSHETAPGLPVTYANYPTAEYLPLDNLDFLTFNVFLESRSDFRRYLTRLHHLAGDRPLVLGEIGLDAGVDTAGARRQAEVVDWQLAVAMERGVAGTCLFSWTDEWAVGGQPVEGWHFGLTTADRTPRPALDVAARWNARTVADLPVRWPTLSVVICAYNAAATLDECLRHTCALDYPGLEVIVVDDGSTDATAEIAGAHPRALLVPIPHAGLSTARNAGLAAASGELIAYLDSDAYPCPEWPFYLVLGMDGAMVGGVGGPNLPPVSDGVGAHQVARAPGGPVHVLLSDDRAEHIPGCNMAFWSKALEEVGGFDPVYTAAGDDVDLCWKVLDRGWEIGFHPAAFVWHHRRGGLRTYLRQQRGYGRAEALVSARHPDRFTPLGSAGWRGRIYNSLTPTAGRQRIYRGLYGAAAYQSVYQGGGYTVDVLHQAGVPAATALVAGGALLAAVGFLTNGPTAWVGAAVLVTSVAFLAVLGAYDAQRCVPPRQLQAGRLRFRAGVALMHLLQPVARLWARQRAGGHARQGRAVPEVPPMRREGGVLVMAADRPRPAAVAGLVALMRAMGLRVATGTGWEDHDARVRSSFLMAAELVTTAHPEGCIQARFVHRPRPRTGVVAAVVAALAVIRPWWGVLGAVLAAAEIGRGWWRVRIPRLVRAGTRAESGTPPGGGPTAPVPAPPVQDRRAPSMDARVPVP